MRKSFSDTDKRLKGAIGVTIATCVTVLACAVTGCGTLNTQDRLRDLDTRSDDALRAYYEGSFRDATNTIGQHILYLDRVDDKLVAFRDIERMRGVAHRQLGYMLLWAGNIHAAHEQINLAYYYHERVRRRVGLAPVPKSEYVDFLIKGTENIDADMDVAWKSDGRLSPNAVAEVKELFQQH